ncbi:MAG: aspartyl protease family protein [bacterium]
MEKIVVEMKIKNLFDEVRAKAGIIKKEEIRKVMVDALVDTGATMLSLPIGIIEKLGLEEAGTREVRTTNGIVTRRVFSEVRVEIQGREGGFQVLELPVDVLPLVGQIVLEQLDLYLDPQNQRLTGRPDAPDHMVVECY